MPLKQLLNEGLSPAKMSQALAAGFVIGITPMLGISSILAVGVAALFKLNHVAIQVANWAAYPGQILAFIPFIRLGEWIFGLDAAVINPSDITTMLSDDFKASIQLYGRSLLAGWFAWLIAATPLAFILRWPLERALNKSFARQDSGRG